LAIHVPNLLFVALAAGSRTHLFFITAAVACEQLGYGFGFAAYLMFMMMVADGAVPRRRTTRCAPASWRWA
jgi:PAT family beta-lactamase induction signal transducer AmpG